MVTNALEFHKPRGGRAAESKLRADDQTSPSTDFESASITRGQPISGQSLIGTADSNCRPVAQEQSGSPAVDRRPESDIINHAYAQVPGRKDHRMRRRAFLMSLPMGSAALLTVSCSSQPEVSAAPQKAGVGAIVRLDPAFDRLVPKDAQIEKLAGGFTFIEGPLWRPSGALWFSDVVGNVVRQWTPDGRVTEILRPGGYDGSSLPAGGFIGPNGMTAGKDGAVLLCQHGNRRIAHIDKDRKVSTLVDRFEGKRLNSPNDLVFRSDGSLFFTDPPYGIP